jgi:3-dehydroquinate dehydratase-1
VAGSRPRLCVALTNDDAAAAAAVEPLADYYEVRIDLIGPGWREVAGRLKKPWIATNRRREEGGAWPGGEDDRVDELLAALDLGAAIVDIELAAPGLPNLLRRGKSRGLCLISYHTMENTPPLEDLKSIVRRMRAAGADICKLVTTAQSFNDNLTVLKLPRAFPGVDLVAFAMGEAGKLSRVLSPLAGACFTFAAAAAGSESAPGQLGAAEMRELYRTLGYE